MKCPDHYAVLGVSDTATEKEIRAAYRALAFQHHPDVSSEQGASTRARFQRIQDAYHVLRHKERRATYDHQRKWNSLVSHAEGQQSWTRPTAGQPDKNDPFAEGFDKWFRDAGSTAEREQEERLRAEMAASWALDKEDAQRVKLRWERSQRAASEARAQRQAATLSQMWPAQRRWLWADRVAGVICALGAGAVLYQGWQLRSALRESVRGQERKGTSAG
ncbi:hypothetical protein H632_c910p0 [Helicosporidium sp. ATCC 50920]|nr:hypothetical protein H632_c910p0 [Helicosporidium sp. ATCC 50920]|eukprot:KDD75037.1 hypothetical protein H632_c910p0 [Helicosporidium sp. ATCC 50920]